MALAKVRYKGLSDERIISVKDLEAHGVKIDKDLHWTRENRHTLVVDGISDDLVAVLRREGTFTITEVDADTNLEGQDIVTAEPSKLDDTGGVVVDATSGQVSEKPGNEADTETKKAAKKAANAGQ